MTLAATGGVYGAGDALKLLLAGADVVHLASALLEHGPGRLSQILDDMKTWMIEREYESVAQLKGSMCQTNLRDASALARQSYIRVLDSFTPRAGCGAEAVSGAAVVLSSALGVQPCPRGLRRLPAVA
jgi:dihydroorotate dehydrogenase (fumarate)